MDDIPRDPAADTASLIVKVRLLRPDGDWTFAAPADEYLLYSMLEAGISCPFVCEQGWCLACAVTLISGMVDRSHALTNYTQDTDAGYALLCSTKPLSDLVIAQDVNQTRREMTQHRISHNLLARAYPPGMRSGFRRGRAK